jgi:hypothetical protein
MALHVLRAVLRTDFLGQMVVSLKTELRFQSLAGACQMPMIVEWRAHRPLDRMHFANCDMEMDVLRVVMSCTYALMLFKANGRANTLFNCGEHVV